MYILIEGIDGSGKDVQALKLKERLVNPLLVAEPCSDLPHGRLLRTLLSSGEYPASYSALFLADRMALQEKYVVPALREGRDVVSVRSFLSSLVYQQEHWPLQGLIDMHRLSLAKPDVIVYLDIDPLVGLDRVSLRGLTKEVYETLPVQTRNRARYLSLLKGKHHGSLLPLLKKSTMIIIVDGQLTPEAVHEAVWSGISPYVK